MKKSIKNYRNTIALFLMLLSQFSFSQVGIGTSSPNSESVLDLSGVNNKGLVLPTTNSTNPFNASGTKEGVLMFNTNNKLIYYSTNLPSDYNTLSPWLYKPTPTDKVISLMDTENNRVLLKNTSLTKRVLLELDFGNINVKSGGDINVDGTGKIKEDGHDLVPAGCVMMWAGQNIPDGWFLCDGASKNKDDFPDLFAAIGISYGGSGLSFNLPNFDDKFPKGNPTTNGFGNTGGDSSHDFTIVKGNLPKHQHGLGHGHTVGSNTAISSPGGSHRHPIEGGGANGLANRKRNYPGTSNVDMFWGNGEDANNKEWRGTVYTDYVSNHTHTITVDNAPSSVKSDDGSSEFLSNSITIPTEPPFLSIKFIIKY